MENTDRIKALFFSQYWGQEILMYENSDGDPFWSKQIYPVDGHNITCKHLQAHLRTGDTLTDAEAIQVAWLIYPAKSAPEYMHEASIGKGYVYNDVLKSELPLSAVVHSYLLRIGVLVDFTYLDHSVTPQTLTPAKLIEMGWVKIREI